MTKNAEIITQLERAQRALEVIAAGRDPIASTAIYLDAVNRLSFAINQLHILDRAKPDWTQPIHEYLDAEVPKLDKAN